MLGSHQVTDTRATNTALSDLPQPVPPMQSDSHTGDRHDTGWERALGKQTQRHQPGTRESPELCRCLLHARWVAGPLGQQPSPASQGCVSHKRHDTKRKKPGRHKYMSGREQSDPGKYPPYLRGEDKPKARGLERARVRVRMRVSVRSGPVSGSGSQMLY